MKKITFLTIAFCCLVFSSYAQINKGTVFLGGSLGFAHQKTETNGTESKQNVANILPAIGIAVRNNLVAGVQLAYSNNRLSDDVMGSEPYSRSYGGGVFVKKYRPLGRNFLLFGARRRADRGALRVGLRSCGAITTAMAALRARQ